MKLIQLTDIRAPTVWLEVLGLPCSRRVPSGSLSVMYQVRTWHGLENLPYWGSLSPLLFLMGKALELMSSMGLWSQKVKVLVAQSCLTLCNPIDCSPTGSSVCGILQARILEWVTIPFSRGSFRPRGFTGRFASQITEKAPNPAIMTLVLWYNL